MNKVNNLKFNDIRSFLLSTEYTEKRKSIAQDLALNKGTFGIVAIASGASTVVSLIASIQYPILGGFLALSSFFTALGAHEIHVIAKNGEALADGSNRLREKAAESPDQFTSLLLKDTLITNRLFGSYIAREIASGNIFIQINQTDPKRSMNAIKLGRLS